MTTLPGVTVVIPNYNMERFVAAAIESALEQDHPDVEVIVVDDASTDGSREIIEAYRGRVRIIFLEKNVGQLGALNTAWPDARHPIVMFLDSDDQLMPHAASVIAAAFRPTTAKVQFCLQTIDSDGRPMGHVAPKYPERLDTETIRQELLRTGSSPCTQGSGNAYAKWVLEAIESESGFDHPFGRRLWTDALLEVNTPFHGDVITLREPLGRYRIHESNWSSHGSLDAARFRKMVDTYDCKLAYMAERCRRRGIAFDPRAARERCLWAFEYRLAAAKLSNGSGDLEERPWNILWPALRACLASPYSRGHRLFRGAWIAAVAVSPLALAARLIEARFVVGQRPQWVERLFPSKRPVPTSKVPALP